VADSLVAGAEPGGNVLGAEGLLGPGRSAEQLDRNAVGILQLEEVLDAASRGRVRLALADSEARRGELLHQFAERHFICHLEARVGEVVARAGMYDDALSLLVHAKSEGAVRVPVREDEAHCFYREVLPGLEVAHLEAEVPQSGNS
jgi:hypothetical protein